MSTTYSLPGKVILAALCIQSKLGGELSTYPTVGRLFLISNSTDPGLNLFDHCARALQGFLVGVEEILFIPYALGDVDHYAHRIRERFSQLGMKVVSIHEQQDPILAIQRAASILVGGGNTFRLLKALQDANLLGPIREKVITGTPYMGSSAGANVACPTIKTTNDMPIVHPSSFAALDLLPFNINPHYFDGPCVPGSMGETREARLREFHEVNTEPVLGLREGAWLLQEGTDLKVQGRGGAKLFLPGERPVLYGPDSDLNWLLARRLPKKDSEGVA